MTIFVKKAQVQILHTANNFLMCFDEEGADSQGNNIPSLNKLWKDTSSTWYTKAVKYWDDSEETKNNKWSFGWFWSLR